MTVGVFGRDSKHCPKCSRPKTKSTSDTNAPQVARNSELLRRAWKSVQSAMPRMSKPLSCRHSERENLEEVVDLFARECQ